MSLPNQLRENEAGLGSAGGRRVRIAGLALTALGLYFVLGGAPKAAPVPVATPRAVPVATALRPGSTRAIEQIRVGDRVLAGNPEGTDPAAVAVDGSSWRRVELRLDSHGDRIDVVLLRPASWLDARRARPGSTIHLDLPELGAAGPARVLEVGPCPPLRVGSGRVVTGTFAHRAAAVLELRLEGEAGPVGVTASHPFWSEDRMRFVAAGQLRPGERLRGTSGPVAVASVAPAAGSRAVYNLEVESEHVYHVSGAGLLVHNACEFQLGSHGSQPSPRPGLESHHVIQDAWAKANVTGYSSSAAPTILLGRGAVRHTIVSAAQNARRDARLAAGLGKWSTSLREEFMNAARDLRNAGVPEQQLKKAIRNAFNYFVNGH